MDKVLIQPKDYIPELEEKVKYFNSITPDLPRNEVIHSRVVIPEFGSTFEQKQWEKEEIRRCKSGYAGICGKQYFYFNYGHILDIERGMLQPDFRVSDDDWFSTVEYAQSSREWGIICVKRRRAGFSWKEAADVLHDCTFSKYFKVGMNSKTEKDSIDLFKKVKFMYDNLPSFLRSTTAAGNTLMSMFFGYRTKDELGNIIKRGTQSEINVYAPTTVAYEGGMFHKIVIDEAGKLPALPQMWSYAEPCLMVDTRRSGLPIVFGTSGEVGKEGRGLKQMWDDADAHKFIRKFFGGWMGIHCDEYGNDLKEEAIRWIVYERYRKQSLTAKAYNDFVQQYPLTVEEAFAQADSGGIGDVIKINKQIISLGENPSRKKKGSFRLDSNGTVSFIPDINGKCIIYEEPKKASKNNYIAGCDPTDHDDTLDEASDQSMWIMEKQSGTRPPHIVFEYTDKPANANVFYEQAYLSLLYYNGARLLIENNRYRMIGYFGEAGHKHLLHHTPVSMIRLVGGKVNSIGVRMTPAVKEYMIGLVEEYIDYHCELIPSSELLQECIDFGSKNTDKAMAFGITLILLKEDTSKVKKADKFANNRPKFSYKNVNGKIIRVNARK